MFGYVKAWRLREVNFNLTRLNEKLERVQHKLGNKREEVVIQDTKIDELTKKLQQLHLDHTLEICPLGTKLKHLGLNIIVMRLEVSREGEVTVVGNYHSAEGIQEIELSLDIVKTLKP